jgi:hypothetical protein
MTPNPGGNESRAAVLVTIDATESQRHKCGGVRVSDFYFNIPRSTNHGNPPPGIESNTCYRQGSTHAAG